MVALDKAGMELDVTVPDGTRRIRIHLSIVCKTKAMRNRPWSKCPSTRATSWRNKPTKMGRAADVE